jgi:hypothetical protein
MHYIATQQSNDANGNASFLVSQLDGNGRSLRMPAKAIDWTDTVLESDEVEA